MRSVGSLCNIMKATIRQSFCFSAHTPQRQWVSRLNDGLSSIKSKMVKQEQISVPTNKEKSVFSRADKPGLWCRRPAATLWSHTHFQAHPGSSWSINPSAVTMKITQTRLVPSHKLLSSNIKGLKRLKKQSKESWELVDLLFLQYINRKENSLKVQLTRKVALFLSQNQYLIETFGKSCDFQTVSESPSLLLSCQRGLSAQLCWQLRHKLHWLATLYKRVWHKGS